MRLHWHRRDLRIADNLGLTAATDAGDVLPVFVFDERVMAHAAPARMSYLVDAVAALREAYRERGGDLHVARGDPRSVLPALAGEHGVEAVHWNEDYSGLARRRDGAVGAALDVSVSTHHDDLHHEPGSITTGAGEPYSVYSYFRRKWEDREKETPVGIPPDDALVAEPGRTVPTLDTLGFEEPAADVEPAGPEPARERLRTFCGLDGDVERAPIHDSEERREYPAENGTSRLSTHLKWGTVGVRTVYDATTEAMERAPDEDARESVATFREELAWREFYTHVLRFNPGVVTENYREYEHDIEWRTDEAELQAWKDGETGYPIVDAGMRQLREEAWMHNRVRMIVASFLTKDLLLDWREGYAWFRERLADHHTANDSGGWQWAASTGTDAQPYFRIFNPTTQGERYDPDGEYVREYVPELTAATTERIHGWTDLSPDERRQVAPDYPDPIVDHAERRERALAMFERARGTEDGNGDES
jgi:deoxyribodipyrimidine photo-lyase